MSPLWGTLAHWGNSRKDDLHISKGARKGNAESMGRSETRA